MHRTLILIAGLVALALLALYCLRAEVSQIEADVLSRSRAALAATGLDISAVVDGQDITLTGQVATHEARERAQRIVSDLPGVRVVDNLLNVAVTHTVPDPYEFSASARRSEVLLKGHVPDAAAQASLVGTARQLFDKRRVIDRLTVSAGAPDDFTAAIKVSLAHLARLRDGQLTVSNRRVTLSGNAYDREGQAAVQAALARGPAAGYTGVARVDLAPPTAQTVRACQTDFDRLLGSERIQFASGSATISADSFPLLDRLAASVKACAGVIIQVQGHTDARGAAESNLALSQRRAQAVVDYLEREGVDRRQMSAKGYGASRPIADNATSAGRAQNRRIELQTVPASEGATQ